MKMPLFLQSDAGPVPRVSPSDGPWVRSNVSHRRWLEIFVLREEWTVHREDDETDPRMMRRHFSGIAKRPVVGRCSTPSGTMFPLVVER